MTTKFQIKDVTRITSSRGRRLRDFNDKSKGQQSYVRILVHTEGSKKPHVIELQSADHQLIHYLSQILRQGEGGDLGGQKQVDSPGVPYG